MGEHVEDHIETARVRRAPRFSVFLLLGGAIGILVAMILTFTFNGTDEVSPNTGMAYSDGQVFGFLLLICIPVGLALAALVALLLDRRSRGRARQVTVDHESVHGDDLR